MSLSPAQGGFRPRVRPQETVYGLLALLHHRKAKKQPSYVAFVDFETAFPSTFKPVVWTCMFDLGIQNCLWTNTRNLYASIRSWVLHPLIPEDKFFEIPQGLREGSKLSPLLFNLAVNDMREYFKTTSHGPLGVTMTTPICEEYAGVWQYADDVALVASSPTELQHMITRLQHYCNNKGLTINLQKTKIVEFRNASQATGIYSAYSPDGHIVNIQTVPSFPYLGVPLDEKLSMSSAVASLRGTF